ncbi:DUF6988 family protein [Chromatocurvus halotolerans]|uniref:Uncharacterized protein n=1 Tax=Chromatocurvus halotolerans TaxID=1132028 RepID=A0A4R2KFE8_9GAMM|nr:hypothetical protein [Chromatocurvus halotolerans]TCO71784.1 hypothetical protein EV688_12138 [Chromatocurvus halotolerans]
MDLKRANELIDTLSKTVDHPLFEDSPRVILSATLSVSSLEFAAAVRILCVSGLLLGASGSLRSQFESVVRSVWALQRATENQVEKLSANLDEESQLATKNMPSVQQMMAELEKIPNLSNLMIALNEFKESSWLPLNSFVHSGIHAVHWTRNEAPPVLLERVFRASNGLVVLAFQNLGILTGKPGLQTEIITATASYSSCLPDRRP